MSFQLKDLVNHPYSFAVGVGLGNGLLAKMRNKPVDVPTALTLATILGLGEMALVVYEPETERTQSLLSIAVYSIAGVLTGLAPFVSLEHPTLEDAAPALLANVQEPGGGSNATAGFGYYSSRARRRPATRRRRVW